MDRFCFVRSALVLGVAQACLTGCAAWAPAPPPTAPQAAAVTLASPATSEPAETVTIPPSAPSAQLEPAGEPRAAEVLAAAPETPATSPTLDPARERAAARQWDAADEEIARYLRDVSQPALREAAEALAGTVRQGRALDTALAKAIEDLGAEDPAVAATARGLLWQHDALAARLLAEACRGNQPGIVQPALALLAARGQSEPAASAALAVLERPAAAFAWPTAVDVLRQLNPPGAGERLLELALSAESPAQQAVALEALAQCTDPPPRTLPALLPKLAADGPALPAALWAAARSAQLHHQQDLATRRGLEALSPDEFAQLQKLAPRMKQLAPPGSEPTTPAARGALLLATAVGWEQPRAIAGVRAMAASGDRDPEGLVDGLWKPADKATSQWVDPVTGREAWVVLDLGESSFVTGVRIWNYSLYGGAERGWKTVEIEVSDDLAGAPRGTALGYLPRYTNTKDADYSTVVDVPAVRGRYVKLLARDTWITQGDQKVSGLAEVEVLGVK